MLNSIYDDVSQLNPDELTVLSVCLIEGSISNRRLQYVLNMHSSDITGMLKKSTDGYLASDNNGRWTIYELTHKVATSKEVPSYYKKNIKWEELEQIVLQ